MENKGYFVVHEWMVKELALKGTELLVYAIIFGFTQIEEQRFFGTRRYLSSLTGCSVRAVQDALNSLVMRELIIKEVSFLPHGGMQMVSYRTNLHPQCEICSKAENAHNDNIHKSISNKGVTGSKGSVGSNTVCSPSINRSPSSEVVKNKYGEHQNVLLTDEEYEKLKERFPTEYQKLIDDLSWDLATVKRKTTYKNHYLTILKWSRNRNTQAAPQIKRPSAEPKFFD